MPEPITHACVSVVLARHFFGAQKWLFVLAAMAPDIDVVIGGLYVLLTRPLPESVGEFAHQSLIFHPSFTAAIWFIPLYSLLLSWVFRRFSHTARAEAFRRIFGNVICGMLFHLGLDLLQTGNRLMWPMAWETGFDILPYTTAGRVVPMVGAFGLLLVDVLLFDRLNRNRKSTHR